MPHSGERGAAAWRALSQPGERLAAPGLLAIDVHAERSQRPLLTADGRSSRSRADVRCTIIDLSQPGS